MSGPEPGTSDANRYSIDVVDDVRPSQRVPAGDSALGVVFLRTPGAVVCMCMCVRMLHGAQRALDTEDGLEFGCAVMQRCSGHDRLDVERCAGGGGTYNQLTISRATRGRGRGEWMMCRRDNACEVDVVEIERERGQDRT